MSEDQRWREGRGTMGTIMANARFVKNAILYIKQNKLDSKFKAEFLWVQCDPQCFPPQNKEQLNKWLEFSESKT